MNEQTSETLEISGPTSNGWYRTQIPDWIALHPDLKDGAFRLYVIMRSLILEKQTTKVRVLSHEQLAFLLVGKNGKSASVSTVKALLRNLHEIGLVDNPDGARLVSSTGNAGIESRRRYRMSDWPADRDTFTGWRNTFDKLDAFTEDWRETRPDAAPTRHKTAARADQGRKGVRAGELEGQKSDRDRQISDRSGQISDANGAVSSGNATSLKEVPEVDAVTSSSSASAPAEPPAPAAEAPAPKKTKKTPEQIVMERTDATEDEARAVVELVLAQAAADGTQVRVPYRWLEDRDHHVLAQDLAAVRRRSSRPGAQTCGLHNVLLEQGGGCSSCYGDLKAGDSATVRAHLAEVGGDARPDLVAVLGAPEAPAGGLFEQDPTAYWRKTNNGYKGGTRGRVITQEEAADLAELTNEEAINQVLFSEPPKRRARVPAYTGFQNPASPDAYTEDW